MKGLKYLAFIPIFMLALGCHGGLVGNISLIQGPDRLTETNHAEFSVKVIGYTDVTYLWGCDPVEAGYFDRVDLDHAVFVANEVDEGTNAKIEVIITTTQKDTIIVKSIVIEDREGWVAHTGEGMSDIAINGLNNIYTIGIISRPYVFYGNEGAIPVVPLGFSDAIILRYDSDGDLLYVNTYGSDRREEGLDIEVNDNGEFYCLIKIWGENGIEQPYFSIVKYNQIGQIDWVSGQVQGYAEDIGLDSNSGTIYVTGYYRGTVDFDPGGSNEDHKSVGYDIFLSRYNTDGEYQWTNTWGGKDSIFGDSGSQVIVDLYGDIYIAGVFCGNGVDFDCGIGIDIRNSIGPNDIFLSKLNANGGLIWTRTWGGESPLDYCYGFELDDENNVYVYGFCAGVTDFDPGPGLVQRIEGGNFVSKFNNYGDFEWVDIWDLWIWPLDISVDFLHNIYLTGIFRNTIDFNPGEGVDYREPYGGSSGFIVKIDDMGEYEWSQTWDDSKGLIGIYAIATDLMGHIYLTGIGSNNFDFDPGDGYLTLRPEDEYYWFIMKMNSNGEI